MHEFFYHSSFELFDNKQEKQNFRKWTLKDHNENRQRALANLSISALTSLKYISFFAENILNKINKKKNRIEVDIPVWLAGS